MFLAMRSNQKLGKNRETFTICSGTRSQSIERGRISWEGALDVRESRERRDKNFAEKQKTVRKRQNFGSETAIFSREFSFFGRGTTNF